MKTKLSHSNLIGKKFNRLTILEKVGQYKGDGTYLYKCKCNCGKIKILQGYRVKNGTIKSCGCWQKDNPPKLKHGMTGTKIFFTWQRILDRCNNKNGKNYKGYGGRGITVCNEWLKFENFRDDMYESYLKHCQKFGEKNTSIDRIDNNGDYCKKNCRWATTKQQNRNRRSNIYLKFKDKEMILADWAKHIGVSFKCLRGRLNRGWTVEQTLTLPHGYLLQNKRVFTKQHCDNLRKAKLNN